MSKTHQLMPLNVHQALDHHRTKAQMASKGDRSSVRPVTRRDTLGGGSMSTMTRSDTVIPAIQKTIKSLWASATLP